MAFISPSTRIEDQLIDYAETSRNSQLQQFTTDQYNFEIQHQKQQQQGQYSPLMALQMPPQPQSPLSTNQGLREVVMSASLSLGSEQKDGDKVAAMPEDFGDSNGELSNSGKQILSEKLVEKAGHKREHKTDEEMDHGVERNCCARCFISIIVWIFVCLTFPFCFCWYFNIVYEYERAVIFRMGNIKTKQKRKKTQTSGIFFTLPCIEEFRKVDMRTQCLNFQPQEVFSSDNILIKVDGIIYYRITNAISCITQITNPHVSITLLTQSILRSLVSKRMLTNILTTREAIADDIKMQLSEACTSWGISIERVAINDIGLPGEFQRAMVAEAEELRYTKAKIVAATGEKESSKAFKEAAEIISSTPGAIQLRYLQTLRTIATENNSTIVFPFPMEFLQGFSTLALHQQRIGVTTSMKQSNPPFNIPELVAPQNDQHVLQRVASAEGHHHFRRSSDPEGEHRSKDKEQREEHARFGKFGHKKEKKDANQSHT